MESYAEKLKAGKERMRQLCIQVALASTPATVRVVRIRKTLSGRAYSAAEIATPRPVTRRALHIFLHECAHVALGHVKTAKTSEFGPTLPCGGPGPAQAATESRIRRKPRHIEEYEAEQWAFGRMRESDIPIPRKSLRRAKSYVAYKIRQARRRGAKVVDREAQWWAEGGRP